MKTLKTLLTSVNKLICVLLCSFFIVSPAFADLYMGFDSLAYSDFAGQATPALLGIAVFFAPIYAPLLALGAAM